MPDLLARTRPRYILRYSTFLHKNSKKMQENLVISKKSSTFAPAFDEQRGISPSGGGRFPRLTGTPPGAIV